ncbi:MAG: nucleotidyltransferase domain-containing protein [Acidimicrobiaceae bacterium]|nr:nucleotidyltransferase domain-containing protein [Acidimicrobiaceae bacterium]
MDLQQMVLVEHRQRIKETARARLAVSIELVGSVARGDYSETSDFDFVVRFAGGASLLDHGELELDLQDILGRPVDVINREALSGRSLAMLEDAIAL